MPYPTEFPKVALATLLGYTNGNPPETAVAVLAGYEIQGYLLSLYFGQTEYPKGINLVKLLQLAQSPEFAKAQEAVKTFAALRAGGTGVALALLKILIQYGPAIFALILKLIDLSE